MENRSRRWASISAAVSLTVAALGTAARAESGGGGGGDTPPPLDWVWNDNFGIAAAVWVAPALSPGLSVGGIGDDSGALGFNPTFPFSFANRAAEDATGAARGSVAWNALSGDLPVLSGHASTTGEKPEFPANNAYIGANAMGGGESSLAFKYLGTDPATLKIVFDLSAVIQEPLVAGPGETGDAYAQAQVGVFRREGYQYLPSLLQILDDTNSVPLATSAGALFLTDETYGLDQHDFESLSFGVEPGDEFVVFERLQSFALTSVRSVDAKLKAVFSPVYGQAVPNGVDSLIVAIVPEPGTGWLCVVGLLGLSGLVRRARRMAS